MNLVQPPSPTPGDDLDGLLRTFFRSELPRPWPAAPFRAAPAATPARAGRPLTRSRWALAASIGLLLLGSLLLPGRFITASRPGQGPEGVGISDTKFHQDMNREHLNKAAENRNKAEREGGEGDELPDPE